jgi:hypothetical protein
MSGDVEKHFCTFWEVMNHLKRIILIALSVFELSKVLLDGIHTTGTLRTAVSLRERLIGHRGFE